jgi:DNA-binding SARP family transcriptional activator
MLPPMRYRVLGPLRVWDGTAWSQVRAAQPRLVLAVLLAEAGQVVSTERLIDEIWGEQPPRSAWNSVHGYVARLRRLLGAGPDGPLLTRDHGYELAVRDGELDAAVFGTLVDAGRRAAAEGRRDTALSTLSEGLALWRGPALADVPDSVTMVAEAARLDQARLGALEQRIDVLLELGRHAATVEELRQLVATHPLRERLWARLVLALHRCGRRGEALDTYQQARATLAAELGVEPGAELRELQQAILTDDPALAASAPAGGEVAAGPVPAQLPPAGSGFTGRTAQLAWLDALPPEPGLLVTITGQAGVGKTTLAVHWGQSVRDRFPDGQLYIELRGYGEASPLGPMEALGRCLRALGMPAEQVPADEEQAAAAYRSLLSGRRMLVLLDNARDATQVRPLLPGTPGCLVLVTSRTQLRGLAARDGAKRLDLEVLPPDEAIALLAGMLGADRVRGEQEATAELARLCGYLPLALRIAGANLGGRPAAPIAGYVRRLVADRLGALEVDGDPQEAVRLAFDHSYAALPADTRRLFRLLGLVPGPDFGVAAAAALADLEAGDAGRLLDRLADAHLIDEHDADRYTLHDLIRGYAAEHAAAEERVPAVRRLFEFYRQAVDDAAGWLYPQALRLPQPAGVPARGPRFGNDREALEWLAAEFGNLTAAVTYAANNGPDPAAWLITDSLRGHAWLAGRTNEWVSIGSTALAAARAAGDLDGQASLHHGLGTFWWQQGDHPQAIQHLTEAIALSLATGWQQCHAVALGCLGGVRRDAGHLREAAEVFRQVISRLREIGWEAKVGQALGNLASVHFELGRLDQAAENYRQALAISQRSGDHLNEATLRSALGECLHAQGHFDEAIDQLAHAMRLHEAAGDHNGRPYTRASLAAVRCDAGDVEQAGQDAQTALAEAVEVGDPRGQAGAHNVLGTVHIAGRRPREALDAHQRAYDLARAAGEQSPEVAARIGLAGAYAQLGHLAAAAAHALAAAAIARRVGYRVHEGNALTTLAGLELLRGRHAGALDLARRALASQAETGHRLGEARSLLVAERASRALGRDGEARSYGERARSLTNVIDPTAPAGAAVVASAGFTGDDDEGRYGE